MNVRRKLHVAVFFAVLGIVGALGAFQYEKLRVAAVCLGMAAIIAVSSLFYMIFKQNNGP